MEFPNAFIVGMPRAGTTSLSYYLREHPQVSFPAPEFKEPHYFSTDIHPRQVPDEGEYLAIFEHSDLRPIRAEASVFYLFSETAPLEIRKHSPDARIVICIREPADWLPSLHAMLLRTGRQREQDLEKAWNVGPKAAGPFARILDYPSLFRISSHVERYLRIFGKEQVHILDYRLFCRDPETTYAALLHFLGLEPQQGLKFDKYNSRNTFWAKNLLDLHPFIRKLAMRIPSGFRHAVSDRIGAMAGARKKSPAAADGFALMLSKLSETEMSRLNGLGVLPRETPGNRSP
jgi:hypothetical protein